MTPAERASLLVRAEKLEDEAIEFAETVGSRRTPDQALVAYARGELNIKAAAILRRRAGERV